MHEIEWTKRSIKQLRKIQQQEQATIYTAVQTLRQWPRCQHVKALANREDYRLRVGRYRILFTVDDDIQIIAIQEVKKRDEQTY